MKSCFVTNNKVLDTIQKISKICAERGYSDAISYLEMKDGIYVFNIGQYADEYRDLHEEMVCLFPELTIPPTNNHFTPVIKFKFISNISDSNNIMYDVNVFKAYILPDLSSFFIIQYSLEKVGGISMNGPILNEQFKMHKTNTDWNTMILSEESQVAKDIRTIDYECDKSFIHFPSDSKDDKTPPSSLKAADAMKGVSNFSDCTPIYEDEEGPLSSDHDQKCFELRQKTSQGPTPEDSDSK